MIEGIMTFGARPSAVWSPQSLLGVKGEDTFRGGVGVFHVKGWRSNNLVCPSKRGKTNHAQQEASVT